MLNALTESNLTVQACGHETFIDWARRCCRQQRILG